MRNATLRFAQSRCCVFGEADMEVLAKENYEEYLYFCREKNANFMQTPQWAGVKAGWKSDIIVLRQEGKIRAGALLLLRKIPGTRHFLLYVPRGPVCQKQDLQQLMQDIFHYARSRRAFCIKIDPYVPAKDSDYHALLKQMGFCRLPAGAMGNTQPKFVYQIEIAEKTPAQILQGFAAKTRYNTRVAERRGVAIWSGGKERLEEFYRLLVQTGRRDGFAVRRQEYYENLLCQMRECGKLFLAEYEGKAVAGAVAIRFGETAWYLYGASSQEAKDAMPNYLLQYRMMLWAAKQGCKLYDMRGISGNFSPQSPLYGLYRFKKGFGGAVQEYLGEYELPLCRWLYGCYRMVFSLRKWHKKWLLWKFCKKGNKISG